MPPTPHHNPLLRNEKKGLKVEIELEVSRFMGNLFVDRFNGTNGSLVDDIAPWLGYTSALWNCARNCSRIGRTSWTLTTRSCSSPILASSKWYSITNETTCFGLIILSIGSDPNEHVDIDLVIKGSSQWVIDWTVTKRTDITYSDGNKLRFMPTIGRSSQQCSSKVVGITATYP